MFGMNAETGLPFYAMRFLGKQLLADAIVAYHAQRSAGHEDNFADQSCIRRARGLAAR